MRKGRNARRRVFSTENLNLIRNAELLKIPPQYLGRMLLFLKGNDNARIYLASKVSQQVSLQVEASP